MQEDEKNHTERKRSIGVISLFNEAQAKLIDKLLDADEYISARKDEHNIRCGTARGFQGDEKDIILLSLVIGNESRHKSDDTAGFNVAVSRARYSITLFHSRDEANLQADDVRKTLLKYFATYKTRKQKVLGEFPVLKFLANGLVGYTVKPIKMSQGFMIQVGSDDCETSCMFVLLGAVRSGGRGWEGEQDICYMLSRLNNKWKALWLFDTNLRPNVCLEEIKRFLKDNNVTPADMVASDSEIEDVGGGGLDAPELYASASDFLKQQSQDDAAFIEGAENLRMSENVVASAVVGEQERVREGQREGEGKGEHEREHAQERSEIAFGSASKITSADLTMHTKEAAASDAATESDRHIGLVHTSHSKDRKNAEAIPLTPADEEGTLSEETDGFEQGIPFSIEHLSQVLTASVSGTLKSMLSYVQRLKAINSEAFKELKQGENGARYKQENIAKIANSIAKCHPDGVTNAQGHLSWLVVSYVYVLKFH